MVRSDNVDGLMVVFDCVKQICEDERQCGVFAVLFWDIMTKCKE